MARGQYGSLVRRYIEEVMNKGHLAVIDHFVSHNVVRHDVAPALAHGIEAIKHDQEQLRAAFPDFRMTIDDLVVGEDKVWCRWTARGTQKGDLVTPFGRIPPTNHVLTWTGIGIYRIANGKIVEHWSERNTLSLMQQIGNLRSQTPGTSQAPGPRAMPAVRPQEPLSASETSAPTEP